MNALGIRKSRLVFLVVVNARKCPVCFNLKSGHLKSNKKVYSHIKVYDPSWVLQVEHSLHGGACLYLSSSLLHICLIRLWLVWLICLFLHVTRGLFLHIRAHGHMLWTISLNTCNGVVQISLNLKTSSGWSVKGFHITHCNTCLTHSRNILTLFV